MVGDRKVNLPMSSHRNGAARRSPRWDCACNWLWHQRRSLRQFFLGSVGSIYVYFSILEKIGTSSRVAIN